MDKIAEIVVAAWNQAVGTAGSASNNAKANCMQQYRHYKDKDGVYDFVCEARLESDPEVTMMVYRAPDGSVWAHPRDVFFELVEVDGANAVRFAPIV